MLRMGSHPAIRRSASRAAVSPGLNAAQVFRDRLPAEGVTAAGSVDYREACRVPRDRWLSVEGRKGEVAALDDMV